MGKTLTVRGVTIGDGPPKICVSMMGKSLEALVEEAAYLKTLDLDLIEWRVDFFEEVMDSQRVIAALEKIRAALIDIPLIFTFRSAKEGGERDISSDDYFRLNKAIVETGLVDLLDVELFCDKMVVEKLIDFAHSNKVYVIVSNHDFQETPSKQEIILRLCKAQKLGGDIPKIAVMPKNAGDVLTLLEATNIMFEQHADRPFITIAMSGLGVISRMCGEVFGSSITFAAGRKVSAPGQVGVTELGEVLTLLHNNL